MKIARPTKKLLRALAGETDPIPPIWLMRQAGRYLPEYRALRARATNFLAFCLTPELAAEATLQPIRRYAMDGAILFSDILVIPHGLTQPVSFREGEGPVLTPVTTAADLARLTLVGLQERIGAVGETVRRVRGALDDATALIGFAGSPWTVASYMVEGGSSRDFARVKAWLYRDPVGFAALIDLLIEATVDYLHLQIEAGAEIIQLFESWAGALASPAFERWVIAPNAAIVARLKATHPAIPVIVFPRGAGGNYATIADHIAVDGIGLDTTVPLEWADRTIPRRVALQGNLDPIALLAGGEALRHEAQRICAALRGRPFIFNLGHGVVPETPSEHVGELVRVVRA